MTVGEAVKLFISYSHRDETLRDELETHLSILKRAGKVATWYDRKIQAGDEWAQKIDDNLRTADIILLLVSSYFLASNYCYDVELSLAMERHQAGDAVVVPVILRPVDWTEAPFAKLQAFPKNAKPVTTWMNQHEAFQDIAIGIRKVAERIYSQKRELPREVARATYLEKFRELWQDGRISIPEQDTLDELQAELGLTDSETQALREIALNPASSTPKNLEKYRKTLLKVIAVEYPISRQTRDDLRLRQQALKLKDEEIKKIEDQIISQMRSGQSNRILLSKASLISPKSEALKNPLSPALFSSPEKPSMPREEGIEELPETGSSANGRREIAPNIDSDFLDRCKQELAQYVGPVAAFLIKEALAKNNQLSSRELVNLLSQEIPNAGQAKTFRDKMRTC